MRALWSTTAVCSVASGAMTEHREAIGRARRVTAFDWPGQMLLMSQRIMQARSTRIRFERSAGPDAVSVSTCGASLRAVTASA